MKEELEYEFQCFLEDMEHGETFGRYFEEDSYEDDYSHSQIDESMSKLEEKIRQWLHQNKPGKYLVTSGWCVWVMTEDEARKRNMWNLDGLLVE